MPHGTDQGPARQIRNRRTSQGPRNRSGPRWMEQQGPQYESEPRGTNQGPVGLIQDEGPAGRIRVSQYERVSQDKSRLRKTEQGPASMDQGPTGRIRARRTDRGLMDEPGSRNTKQSPVGRSRAPGDKSGPSRTKDSAGRIGAPRDGP